MKRRYSVLGLVTAMLPNLYAYAGESQASSMAGGDSTSQATTQETSQSDQQASNQASNSQSSSAGQRASTQATTQSNNEGGVQPYLKPVGSSTKPAQGASVSNTLPAAAKPVVKNYGSKSRTHKRAAVIRNY